MPAGEVVGAVPFLMPSTFTAFVPKADTPKPTFCLLSMANAGVVNDVPPAAVEGVRETPPLTKPFTPS